jgi:fructosamine-3-kinase
MSIPSDICNSLGSVLSTRILNVRSVSGGDINQAARVETTDGSIFVKWNLDAPRNMFSREAHVLEVLRDALSNIETLTVPRVIALDEKGHWLAQEWIEAQLSKPEFARRFVEGLATLHQLDVGNQFGFDNDNYIGVLPQINSWRASWPEFYRDCRLMPQIEIAHQRKYLDAQREYSLKKIADNLDVLFKDFDARPSLLHGDLWNGNFIAQSDKTVLIDPASYIGEREIEIAFIELFGGFPAGFVAHYNAAFALQPGYEKRRPLHQLYPLLVHLNHFGEAYGSRVDTACAACLNTLKNRGI